MTTKKKFVSIVDIEKRMGRLTFARILESLRLSDDISQRDFAATLGITPSSLCDLEKGRRIPSISRAKKIAHILDLNEVLVLQTVLQDQLEREGCNHLKVKLQSN